MIVQIGTEVDESRILWKYKESDEWERADIDDLIHAYENRPKGAWIPVSERLPEVGEYVLASVHDHCVDYNIIINKYEEQAFWREGRITAWQPLPEPYKGE